MNIVLKLLFIIQSEVEKTILKTPSGDKRNTLTEINIIIYGLISKVHKVI